MDVEAFQRFLLGEADDMMWDHLRDGLLNEAKYQPSLCLKRGKKDISEITSNMRDSFTQVLRCLKVWYDVPPDCLFVAINIMDRFLTKMKVLPKHLACIAVSCFHVAVKLTCKNSIPVSSEDILNISQTQCTVSDMNRMEEIITKKLASKLYAVTPLHFISIFCIAYKNLKNNKAPDIHLQAIIPKIEILACSYECTKFKASVLALSLFTCMLENASVVSGTNSMKWIPFVMSLQDFCMVDDDEFIKCREVTMSILDSYNQHQQFPLNQRQRLVWKLSKRTLLQLKPTARMTSVLPTIKEADLNRSRLDSDSDGMGGGSDTSSDYPESEDDIVHDSW